MPTTHIASGISATIRSQDTTGDFEKIKSMQTFALLLDRCQAQGLSIIFTSDNPSDELIILIGKWIHCDVSPGSGLLVNQVDDLSVEQRSASETIFIDMMTLLLKAGYSPTVRRGLVVIQYR